jgi:signal peptidase I
MDSTEDRTPAAGAGDAGAPAPSDPGTALGPAPPDAAPALRTTPDPIATAPPAAREARPRRVFGSIFEVALVVLLALFLALLLKIYVAEAYEIRGRSMEPTFQEEQRVMILKVFYGIQRGDIIIFSSVDNPAKDLIKRVIGLPGDVVEMRHGKVYVNGSKLDEPYVHPSAEDVRPEKVQPGKYYVLGDNRPDSMDSRKFHPIDAASIKGKVILRWWPLEKLNSF